MGSTSDATDVAETPNADIQRLSGQEQISVEQHAEESMDTAKPEDPHEDESGVTGQVSDEPKVEKEESQIGAVAGSEVESERTTSSLSEIEPSA